MDKQATDSGSFKYITTKSKHNTKENENSSLILKDAKTNIFAQTHTDGDTAFLEAKGKDLDQESTTQNILNIARKGDLSPRHIEKGKSTGKGKKKQLKDTHILQPASVQTRRTISKLNLLQ